MADLEGSGGKGVDKYLPTFSVLDCLAGETSLAYVPYLMFGQNFLDDKIYLAAGKLSLGDWFDIKSGIARIIWIR